MPTATALGQRRPPRNSIAGYIYPPRAWLPSAQAPPASALRQGRPPQCLWPARAGRGRPAPRCPAARCALPPPLQSPAALAESAHQCTLRAPCELRMKMGTSLHAVHCTLQIPPCELQMKLDTSLFAACCLSAAQSTSRACSAGHTLPLKILRNHQHEHLRVRKDNHHRMMIILFISISQKVRLSVGTSSSATSQGNNY